MSAALGDSCAAIRDAVDDLAAWTGFTLPSAVLLVFFAFSASALSGSIGIGLLHGLKLVAVAIVSQAVWGMARTLCPDRERASIAVAATLIVLFTASSLVQMAALYSPVWTSSVRTPGDFGLALVGFVLLTAWRAPPLLVVIVSALGAIALNTLSVQS
jgi:hypothetical protein